MGQELAQAYQAVWCSIKLLRHVFDSVIHFNYTAEVYKSWAPGRPNDCILYGGA
jgi:hypothetical protein